MEINKNYKIESDSLNCTLFYRADNKKNWIPAGYYSDPRGCLEKLIKLEIGGTGLKDLKTVCEKIDELKALIKTIKALPHAVECLTDIPKDKMRGNHQGAVTKLPAGQV
jgi:hypothetical protein